MNIFLRRLGDPIGIDISQPLVLARKWQEDALG
ncbi:MAG: hypothetical protein CM15mP45_14080 [Deltaproteobacteria bacterium]|nr:MAG: hypothetical protein CM15mP45_14080 [Deltaproteobacteria bacterium]